MNIESYFAKDITFILASSDTNRDENLKVTLEADAQSLNLYERGMIFYDYCPDTSQTSGYTFYWKRYIIDNVVHSNVIMVPITADILYKNVVNRVNSEKCNITNKENYFCDINDVLPILKND